MKHSRTLALAAAAALGTLLAGCASTPQPTNVAKPSLDRCMFPDSPKDEAPGWVCDQPVEGVKFYAVGVAAISKAGPGLTKDMAVADGRKNLAQQMKVQVQAMVKAFAETTGAGDTETVDKVNTSVTKQITDETLIGSKSFRQATSPAGSLYVLVGLDEKLGEAAAKQALKTSMNNDQAIWQKLQGKKATDELAEEIAKQKTGVAAAKAEATPAATPAAAPAK